MTKGRLRGWGAAATATFVAALAVAVGMLTGILGKAAGGWADDHLRLVWLLFAALLFASLAMVFRQNLQSKRDAEAALLAARAKVVTDLGGPRPDVGANATASQMLDPATCPATFFGRAAELNALADWCTDGNERFLALSGPAQVGKTRTVLRFAEHPPAGWLVSRLRLSQAKDAWRHVCAVPGSQVIVVDLNDVFAVGDRSRLRDLRDFVADAADSSRLDLRVLVVSRSPAALDLLESRAEATTRSSLRAARHVRIGSLSTHEEIARRTREAAARFAALRGVPDPRLVIGPAQAEEAYGVCLARALASVLVGEDTSRDIWRSLADEEMVSWPPLPSGEEPLELRVQAFAAAVITRARNRTDLRAAVGRLRKIKDADAIRAVDWLAQAYPGDADPGSTDGTSTFKAPAAPLSIGIAMHALERTNTLLWSLTKGMEPVDIARCAAWFLGAAAFYPEAMRLAKELLAESGSNIDPDALLTIATAAPGERMADEVLAAWVRSQVLDDNRAEKLESALGDQRAFLSARVAVAEVRLRHAEASGDPEKRAVAHRALGRALRAIGRDLEALPHAEEAVALLRPLAEDSADTKNPDRHTADLATALQHLSVTLGNLGRYQEALPHAEEAVTLLRPLATANPDRYVGDLGNALQQLGSTLGELGRYGDGLPHSEEAVTLLRPLATHQPDRHNGDLAHALQHLSVTLWSLGRFRDGLPHAQEAVVLLRPRATANPDRYVGDLANALQHLGSTLGELTRYQDALPHSEEAVTLLGPLATHQPDRYTGDLANAFQNLSVTLWSLGSYQDALRYDEDAVALLRPLATNHPDRHNYDLAAALHNLGLDLQHFGRIEDALAAAEECLALRLWGFQRHPERYRAELPDAKRRVRELIVAVGREGDILTRSDL